MLEIYVYSDYVCPFCYFGETELEKALEGIEDEVEVHLMPWELYPKKVATPHPEDLKWEWNEKVVPAARQLGISANMPQIIPQPRTELALTGLQFALEHDLEKEYNSKVFEAYYQKGLDIGNEEILVEIAKEIGLNASEFQQALHSKRYLKAHQNALQHAFQQVGIQDIPAFIIGDELFEGLFPHDFLREIILKKLSEG